jgi:hypothetical protein
VRYQLAPLQTIVGRYGLWPAGIKLVQRSPNIDLCGWENPHFVIIISVLTAFYSDCQKKVAFAEGFFATGAYAAILLRGAVL